MESTPRPSRRRAAQTKQQYIVAVSGFDLSKQDTKTLPKYCQRLIKADDLNDLSNMSFLIASDKAGGSKLRPTTIKCLVAYCLGVPIIEKKWLTESEQCGRALSINDFLVDSKEVEKEHGFSLQKTLQNGKLERQKGGLLRGVYVYICPGGKIKRVELEFLLHLMGANLLSKQSQLGSVSDRQKLIIIEGNDTANNRAIIKKARSCLVKTITHADFLDVVMKQDLSVLKLPTVYEEGSNSGPIDDTEQTSPNKSVQKDDSAKKSKKRRGKKDKVVNKDSSQVAEDKFGDSTQTPTPTNKKDSSQPPCLERLTLTGPNRGPIVVENLIIVLKSVTVVRTTSQGMDNIQFVACGRFEVRQKGSKVFVQLVDNEEKIIFRAEVPPQDKLHLQVQGNAGREPSFFWEAYNTAGQSTLYRRYFFHFENVGALTLAIHYMAGCNPAISAKEFFDKDGRFFAKEYTRPSHVMNPREDDMDLEDNIVTRDKYYSDGEVKDLFDNDPYAETQQF